MNLEELLKLKSSGVKVILFGSGLLGKLAFHSLDYQGIKVSNFYDSDQRKQNKKFCNKKIINFEELMDLSRNTIFFITNNYINSVTALLRKLNFNNIYNCVELFNNTNFSKIKIDLNDYDYKSINREINFHKVACEKIINKKNDILNLKCVDIVVTEKCSMKCKDCSNLMQYYVKPQNADLNILFKSLDKFMNCIDWLYEFRVIGGDPFMNKELYKIINKLNEYNNVGNIVIYTNATIMPKNENFECLKNKKVIFEITNYGNSLSRKHDELITELKAANIHYRTKPPGIWNECGTLKFYERSTEELQRVFDNCCMNDVTTMIHGVLYRCPFAANATTLNAVPFKEEEVVNLNNDNYELNTLRKKIKNFNNNDKPLIACSYCGGRDYKTKEIQPAIQVKKYLPYKQYNN